MHLQITTMITLVFSTISDLRSFKLKTNASPLEIIFSNNSITGPFSESDIELAENSFNAIVKYQGIETPVNAVRNKN